MIRMSLHLFGYDLRAFARNRQAQFFTLALPVLFLVIFASVFGGSGNTTQITGGQISTSAYYVPGIIALGVIAACFGNLVASVTAQRERGVLKRRRATPVPAAAVIAGRVLTAVVIAVAMAAVLLGIGWAVYGAHVPGRTREVPKMGFLFFVYAIWRAVAQRRPFLCPECEAAVLAGGPLAA